MMMMSAAAATQSARWRVSTSDSGSTVWATPPALFLALNQEFDFTIDVAADSGNAHVERYFDTDADALRQSWAGERVFCNPPYGRDLGRWVKKAYEEAIDNGALVVMVLPARTGNSWFHQYCLPHATIRFIRGRLGFTVGTPNARRRAPFDSMIVVFHPWCAGRGHIETQPTFPGFARQ